MTRPENDRSGRSDVRMPRGEVGLLLAIVAFAVLTFLPLTHDVMPAGVSMVAWQLWFLMMAAPAAGLVLALRSGRD